MSNSKIRTYLYQHNCQNTAKIIGDYPWGFRLRTTIRYWIETKKAKNGGQRFGSQTINPKTGQWCAPKYSTYSPLIVMFLDENNHIQWTSLGYHSGKEMINAFRETHLENLNDYQKETLKEIIAFDEVMKNVTFTVKASSVGPVSLFSQDPQEIEKRKQLIKESEERQIKEEESLRQINKAIHYEMNKIEL